MNRIRMLREKQGMTQAQLAAVLNCRDATVSRYEKEKLGLDVSTINTLCDLFGVTADYLLCRSEIATPQLTEAEWQLLAAYRAANVRDRGLVDQILAAYVQTAGEGESAI